MNREKVYTKLNMFVSQTPQGSRFSKRVKIVLHVLYLGFTLTATAKMLGTTQKTVKKWIKRYQEAEKFGLLDAPRSVRPATISPQLWNLWRIAQSDVAQYSDAFTSWSLQTIHRYLGKSSRRASLRAVFIRS